MNRAGKEQKAIKKRYGDALSFIVLLSVSILAIGTEFLKSCPMMPPLLFTIMQGTYGENMLQASEAEITGVGIT